MFSLKWGPGAQYSIGLGMIAGGVLILFGAPLGLVEDPSLGIWTSLCGAILSFTNRPRKPGSEKG